MKGDFSRRQVLRFGGAITSGLLAGAGSARPQAVAAPLADDVEPNTEKRRGTGLRGYDAQRASTGYTLFTPLLGGGVVYLVDLQGTVVHAWQVPYPPGAYAYITDRGTLFYNGNIPNDSYLGKESFNGGAALEVDWSGNVLWEVRRQGHHHDGRRLKNGNVLLLCAEELPDSIASNVQGGLAGTEAEGRIWADYLVELTTAGEPVWTWRTWEHIDPTNHPITLPSDERAFWTHGNAVWELDDGNLLLSMRNISTIVRINRQTNRVDWELGPPPLAGAHGVNQLANGNLLIFDNGPYRLDQSQLSLTAAPFSRVIEIDPATQSIVWTYQQALGWQFFSALLSNAQRLPNGNTLINEGLSGRLFQVTPTGDVVWEYVSPYFGPAAAPDKIQSNMIFRAYHYSEAEIADFRGR
jgi:arylsulfotransferase ASST